ncbi:transcription termination factor NusA [Thermostilla marina]
MNPREILRIVDAIHRDKNIDKEIVFQSIEAALLSVARKRFGDDADVTIKIDRETGVISGTREGQDLDPEELSARIGAQSAKQVIIQKIREAERDTLYAEYVEQIYQLVTGTVQKIERGTVSVALPNIEAILPRGEQIPGEQFHHNQRVRAIVCEVKKSGTRLKVILSRTRPQFVQRLFEQEIPEVDEGVIEIKQIAREPGYRSKVAVATTDPRVDCVGACVGVRGNRIRNIIDELSGERIDIVRWDDDLMVLIPNALQPAEVDEVILCQMLGRAIVLVNESQLPLAIGKNGQNVRLASKLCGWDIEIMTREELDEQLEKAFVGFGALDGMDEALADRLVGEGFLSYDDLSVIEPDDLMEMGGLTAEQADHIIEQAEILAEEAERQAKAEREAARQRKREQAIAEQAEAAKAAAESSSEEGAPAEPAESSADVDQTPSET